GRPATTARRRASPSPAASTLRTRSTTTSTAASWSTCCASSSRAELPSVDVRSLKLHLLDHHVRLVLADERGERGHDLEGESFERVISQAAPLLAALELKLGGACHLQLRAISIDPIRSEERRVGK